MPPRRICSTSHPRYLLGQMPSILQHVRRHLARGDPRREELQRIGARLGLSDRQHPPMQIAAPVPHREPEGIVEQERVQIVAAMRAASSASLREQGIDRAATRPLASQRRTCSGLAI